MIMDMILIKMILKIISANVVQKNVLALLYQESRYKIKKIFKK